MIIVFAGTLNPIFRCAPIQKGIRDDILSSGSFVFSSVYFIQACGFHPSQMLLQFLECRVVSPSKHPEKKVTQ